MSSSKESLKDWVAQARKHKQHFFDLKEFPDGTMPPVIYAERCGKVLCQAIAPTVDKSEALSASNLLRVAGDCDVIHLILDARMRSLEDHEGEMDLEELKKKFYDSASTSIKDCVLYHSMNRGLKLESVVLPYTILEDKLEWQEKDDQYDAAEHQGFIPKSLKEIMSSTSLLHSKKMGRLADALEIEGFDCQQKMSMRASLTLLARKGYKVRAKKIAASPDLGQEPLPGVKIKEVDKNS